MYVVCRACHVCRVCLFHVGGEVKYPERTLNFDLQNIKQLITCMSFCSGFATVCLVAELTGLTDLHKVGSEHKAEVPGLKILLTL